MFLAALILGFTGSLHCAGMCSPLAMTVTGSAGMINRLLYNFGRICVYGMLGAMMTSVGYLLPISNFQNVLSIVLGLVLIALAFFGVTNLRVPVISEAVVKFTAGLKKIFAKFIYRKTPASSLLLGALNGLLPCGLTFLALSFSIAMSEPLQGFAYMFIFGIGTLPVMLGLVSIADVIKNRFHWNIKAVTTGLMVVSGIVLIARVFFIHVPHQAANHANVIDIVICR